MDFSIVIASKNEIEYIQKCIESIYSQDYKGDYEVLIIDGMSTDGTQEKLLELQKKYKFKLYKNEKVNAAAGRNIGIKNAKGKYISFIDADAIADKSWLTETKKCFEHRKDAAGVGGPDHLPKDSTERSKMIGWVMSSPLARGGKLNPSTQHSLLEEEKTADHIPTCNLCIKKEILEKIGFFDEEFVKGQDLELNYRINKAGHKLIYSPKVKVVHYRKHHTKDFTKQIYKWAKAKVAIIKKHGFDGITSHIYLWPAYLIAGFFGSILFFYLLNLFELFVMLFFIGSLFYILVVLFESGQLSKKYKSSKLFFYSIFLIPIVHLSYFFGIIYAISNRKIWK